MSRLKELFSDTMVYGLSSVVARFINYLLVPFYTRFFDPGEYGVIGLVYAAFVFLNVLFTFGMESSYIRYASERDRSADVFKTIQVTILALVSILAGLMWVSSGVLMPVMSLEGEAGRLIYLLMIAILCQDALSTVPFAELRIARKAWTYALIRIINVAVNIGLNLFLIAGLGFGIEAVLISNIAASSVTCLILFLITIRLFKGKWRKSILRNALLFGLPYVPNGIGFAINEVVDRFWLNNMKPEHIQALYGDGYTGEDITGIYNACYKLGIFMLLLVQMFRMAWQPFFMKYGEDLDAGVLFRDVFNWFNFAASFIFLGIGLFVYQIAALPVPGLNGTIIDSRYWLGLSIVPWLLAAYWFQGWFVVFSAGIFIKDQTFRLPGITLVGSLITIAGNTILVPVFGMLGAAATTLVCYAAMSVILLHYAGRAINVPYAMMRGLGVMILVATLVFSVNWISVGNGSDLNIRILVFVFGSILLFWIGYPGKICLKRMG